MKRYIKVLADLPLCDLEGKQVTDGESPATCSHSRFVAYRTADPSFSASGQFTLYDIISGDAIRSAFLNASVGDYVSLDSADYERLKLATEKGNYDALHAGSLLPFMKAILDATITDPRNPQE